MKHMKMISVMALLVALFTLAGCAGKDATAPAATQTAAASTEAEAAATQAVAAQTTQTAAGGDLVIPISTITGDANYYPIDVDGTEMEVIAVRAPDGTIRTAFNTCQVCYGSGRGYYVQ